jgi:hypothetical protein
MARLLLFALRNVIDGKPAQHLNGPDGATNLLQHTASMGNNHAIPDYRAQTGPMQATSSLALRAGCIRMIEEFDVVAGSGAAALVAALRCADLRLSALIVEKTHRYGGTTATSGGSHAALEWWDNYLFRADTLPILASKNGVA